MFVNRANGKSQLGLKIGYLMSGVLPDTVKIPVNGYKDIKMLRANGENLCQS
jgi:hypothetical protein